jgi:hypothetical protein
MNAVRYTQKKPTPAPRQRVFALQPFGDPALRLGLPDELVRHARIEAEALAWSTPVPELVLPALFEEKLVALRHWHTRQQRLLGSESASFAA